MIRKRRFISPKAFKLFLEMLPKDAYKAIGSEMPYMTVHYKLPY